ncbi:serine hydrolase domain-containing protein [Leucothrix mucor]|uniref:serine hydrolase domain-containing protein n=1 Tax=Leucothrix mucor TaxID=45248 RepID=UPI0003B5A119|nr:serine hydrolase [Leucothrix mucor]
MKKWIISILLVLLAGGGAFWATADKDMRRLILNFPTNTDVLFWSTAQRDAAFRALDRMTVLADSRVIPAGEKVYPLPQGEPLDVGVDVDAFMQDQRAAALVVVQDGKIRLEKYGLDFTAAGRWTSFSVAKSITSTLLGAAIQDGYINSVDEMVSDYIPDLKGSVYDTVTIQQLMTMTSGVQWNEDYADPNSDVARFNAHKAEQGVDVTVSYMRQLTREAPPGTKWVYKTGETNLIGVLVSSATQKNLSEYLSEKICQPFGMEQDASWILGTSGHEISGCCVQAATRDFARFGLFILNDGIADGQRVLPEGWVAEATMNHIDSSEAGYGYGYQWWNLGDGAYMARGIFGQGIFIDPSRNLVIASNSNWPQATDTQGGDQEQQRLAFYRQVQLATTPSPTH